MKHWKALVVDDEPLARMEIMRLLQPFDHISVIGEAGSVVEAAASITSLSPDLVFLDIDLGAQSGFDLLELTGRRFHTIFVTAYDQYAIRAFEINALDYLLKPVHPDRLKEAIARLGRPEKKELRLKLEPFDKILLSNYQGTKFISIADIQSIEAKGDYTRIKTSNGVHGLVHHTLKRWMERLPSPMFLQVHRSFIVNVDQVEEILKQTGDRHMVRLKNDADLIPVSRTCLSNLKASFRVD